MEATVEKLEAMFLKSETDLEYIEKRLKLDLINNAAENKCPTKNLAMMMDTLKDVKRKHLLLCAEVKEITAMQKESMSSIQNHLNRAMELSLQLQQTAHVQIEPLNKSEQEAAALINSAVNQTTPEWLTQSVKDE
ncbi:SKA complex subunit 2 [Gouania willdenowi]|uniref:Protein FAM33A n=1 Tax=Gouania willdenowi TaxID=441366 RepID=A0A8C5HCB4_GOUWI|nr:spindle and kinetochore-associated protein 2 [Gouania willdenowi]